MLFPDGAVALVTGASKGIGAACAIDLAREGATVVVNYNTDEAGAKSVVAEIESFGGRAEAVQADVSDDAAVRRMFQGIRREHGKLDVLVANAGITIDKVMMSMTRDDFESVLMTNVTGVFLCCKEAARLMTMARKGSIITLSSITARGYPAVSNYSASKAAVASFTKSIATELALAGVRANTVSPGLIETAMTKKMHPQARKAFVDATALARGARPEEVAYLVSFLASDKASYITGADIAIDGGSSLGMVVPASGLIANDPGGRRKMAGARGGNAMSRTVLGIKGSTAGTGPTRAARTEPVETAAASGRTTSPEGTEA